MQLNNHKVKTIIKSPIYVFCVTLLLTINASFLCASGADKGILAKWDFENSDSKLKTQKGIIGKKALIFKSGFYVDGGTFDALSNPSELTILAWFKVDRFIPGKYHAVIAKTAKNKSGLEWALYYAGWNNLFSFVIQTKKHGLMRLSMGPARLLSGWNFIAAVYKKNRIELYHNGKKITSKNGGGNVVTGSGDILIGKLNKKSKNYFEGAIDKIVIYNKALSAKEIRDISGVPRKPTLKVVDSPASLYVESNTKSEDTEKISYHDMLKTMRSVQWLVAPEASAAEIEQIVKHVHDEGFNAFFLAGSFRYMFADEYGPRNWWNAIPWETYKKTASLVAKTCRKYKMKLFFHLTCNLGLTPDFEKKFKGMATKNIQTNADGFRPKYHGYSLCSNNPSFRKMYLTRLTELVELTNPDGLMIDEVSIGPSVKFCGCEHCRKLFKNRYNADIPSPKNREIWRNDFSETWRNWQKFRNESVSDWKTALRNVIIKSGKNKAFTGCGYNPISGYIPYHTGVSATDQNPDIYFYEAEPLHPWAWRHAIAEGKYCGMNSRPVMLMGYAATISQQFFSAMLGMANGWALHEWPEFNQFRTVPALWQKKWEKIWCGNSQFGEVAFVFSSYSNYMSGKFIKGYSKDFNEYIGWAQCFIEEKIQFEVLLADKLKDISKYKTLILPDTICMSEKQMGIIRNFVKNGGTLIATDQSSLFDENGKKRKNFGLSNVFGVTYKGEIKKASIAAGTTLVKKRLSIKGPVQHVLLNGAVPLAELTIKNIPAITTNNYGKGKCIYIAFSPGVHYAMPKVGGGWYGINAYWKDTRIKEYKKLMNAIINKNTQFNLKTDNIPDEIFVNAFKHKYGKYEGIAVHMLNCLGTKFKDAVFTPKRKLYEFINYPSPNKLILSGKKMTIRVKVDNIKGVFIISPDFYKVVQLAYKKLENGFYEVVVPDMGRYQIVYIQQSQSNLILDTESRVTKRFPAILPFKTILTSKR